MFEYIALPQHVEFAARFNHIARWGHFRLPVGDALDHDDAFQTTCLTYLKLGQDPAWQDKPVNVWLAYLKKAYSRRIFYRQRRTRTDRHTVFAEDEIRDQFPSGQFTGEELRPQERRRILSDTHQIHLADLRIDLERGINQALQRHDDQTRADLLALMDDIMDGYTQPEMKRRHGWTEHELRQLMLKLKAMRQDINPDYQEPDRNFDKYEKARQLRAQGLSYTKIGNLLGHSQGWAMYACKGFINEGPSRQSVIKAQNEIKARELRNEGLMLKEIAAALGVGLTTVKRYLKATA